MQYLAFLGGYAESGSLAASGSGVESKVLESNPLLEAFGNAKTVRNANSSRFGKFTEIQFDKQWRIVGAAVRTYLLERSRVVAVNDPERNYHIFYQLCAGASAEERARLHLVPPIDFNYLNKSSCVDIPGVDNAAEYAATRRAMAIVGIPPVDQVRVHPSPASPDQCWSPSCGPHAWHTCTAKQQLERCACCGGVVAGPLQPQWRWLQVCLWCCACMLGSCATWCVPAHAPGVLQEAIFAVVAAVLHLGNCDFVEDPDTDGGCKLTDTIAERHLAWAAELLCVDGPGLLRSLSTRTRQTPDGPIVSPISFEAALSNRDSLAKTIYSRLFDWLVQQVRARCTARRVTRMPAALRHLHPPSALVRGSLPAGEHVHRARAGPDRGRRCA